MLPTCLPLYCTDSKYCTHLLSPLSSPSVAPFLLVLLFPPSLPLLLPFLLLFFSLYLVISYLRLCYYTCLSLSHSLPPPFIHPSIAIQLCLARIVSIAGAHPAWTSG
ncbi:hypothetical protein BO99DRAFT_31562 [Aspergillus violaceofuscus CBS 115571]|uniref:Uncharacterized protein n=1 Tax=Aspergillus violaceofuscus (strain CBS 115571) TaxID=1450538 RepID=A0A2V5HHZ6_ASPV1|nr:hypothetical protein BO99DRAFT_31562 [Aspergillus violaceofuscus CBS 115571]